MAGWGRCRGCGVRIWFGPNPNKPNGVLPFDSDDEQVLHFETCAKTEWLIDSFGQRQRINECKTCGEKVWWQTTPNGARRPMDVEQQYGEYECHFDTCAGVRPETASVGAASARAVPIPTGVQAWAAALGLSYPPLPSEREVVSAFRKLATKHHPDMGGRAEDFIRIKLACDGLKAMVAA